MYLADNDKKRLRTNYGEWAVVTGASSGIGLELAQQVAASGIHVVLVARSADKLNEVATELSKKHSVATRIIAADIADPGALQWVMNVTDDLHVGLFIASAGYGTSGLFIDNPIGDEKDMLEVNCGALLALTHHFARRFAKQHRGGIILLSSIVAFQGVPYASNYAATKAYVQTLAEGLAVELKPFGVHVLAAAPGPVKSGFENRAGMKMGNALTPKDIGVPILKALGRRRTVFPGRLTKILMTGLRTVPRWGKVKIMTKVMQKMTKHRLPPASTI